jgi:hypothetical protein
MQSSPPKRRFPPPWAVQETQHGYVISDSNGIRIAAVYHRDDLHKIQWDNYWAHLTADEARRIAKAISRIPEFMRKDYHAFKVSDHPRWSKTCPYHVALAETYVQENYDEIIACCRYNGVPCNRTGGVEEIEGRRWCVYKFARQIDAIRFWDKFNGRWMRHDFFLYPERPVDLQPMRSLAHHGAL